MAETAAESLDSGIRHRRGCGCAGPHLDCASRRGLADRADGKRIGNQPALRRELLPAGASPCWSSTPPARCSATGVDPARDTTGRRRRAASRWMRKAMCGSPQPAGRNRRVREQAAPAAPAPPDEVVLQAPPLESLPHRLPHLPPPSHDAQILKFSRTGQFLAQYGKPGTTDGNASKTSFNRPANLDIDAAANEVYVADGYGNRRVVVLDARHRRLQALTGARTAPQPDDRLLRPTIRPHQPQSSSARSQLRER